MNTKKLRHTLKLAKDFTQYNLKIIFSNKFGYFLFTAVIFFFIICGTVLYDNSSIDEPEIYNLLIFPALLLIFYPTVFGIQNDKEARMLENLFGIPNYRYKVWLVRLLMMFISVFLITCILGWLTHTILVRISVIKMAAQLMFPIVFMGSLSFMLSTLIKNGNGTAVVIVIIGLMLWMLNNTMDESKWYIFLNPFYSPKKASQALWEGIILQNRIFLTIGSILLVLYGLINLQKREKFI